MAMGHGLDLSGGMAADDDGRLTVAVSGAIDLVALARRAIAVLRRHASKRGKDAA